MMADSSSTELIKKRFAESAALKEVMGQDGDFTSILADVAETIVAAYQTGHKVLLFGNGGSAADAQHIAAELVGRFYRNREPLAAIALNTNTSSITAIGNDFAFDDIFARQVKCLGQPGDVAIGLSTSGDSENVVRGLREATALGLRTVALTGSTGGKIRNGVEHCLRVPSTDTARIQEGHITAAHIVCELVERGAANESQNGRP